MDELYFYVLYIKKFIHEYLKKSIDKKFESENKILDAWLVLTKMANADHFLGGSFLTSNSRGDTTSVVHNQTLLLPFVE